MNELVLKYYYDTLREIIYHDVECLGDTVYTEKLITSRKKQYLKNYHGGKNTKNLYIYH